MSIFEGKLTVGQFVTAVCAIHDEAEALAFLEVYRDYLKKERPDKKDNEHILRSNIGWCFGEGMSEGDRLMWHKICQASHPFFGTRVPSSNEAFTIGEKMGHKMRREWGATKEHET